MNNLLRRVQSEKKEKQYMLTERSTYDARLKIWIEVQYLLQSFSVRRIKIIQIFFPLPEEEKMEFQITVTPK